MQQIAQSSNFGSRRSHSICIIAPGNLASNPRAVKEASALKEAGYDVCVIAAQPFKHFAQFDEEIIASAPWRTIQVGKPRLGRRLFQKIALGAVRYLAAADREIPFFLANLANAAQTTQLTHAALATPAHLYIAHYTGALPAAAAAARKYAALLGFDAEDFHAGEHPDGAEDLARTAVITTIEATLLPRCVHLTSSAPLISTAYHSRYGVAPVTVLNVFPISNENTHRANADENASVSDFSAYWFSQTIGLDRGLQAFIEAMALTKSPVRLVIRGNDPWGHGRTLLKRARQLGVEDRVQLLPLATPRRMVELAAEHNFGLCLETGSSANHRYCLANKIFTYLVAGIPVLMSDTPAQRLLAPQLLDAAAVISLSDPQKMADAIDRWALAPSLYSQACATARRLAEERFSWEKEKVVLLESVARALQCR